MAQANAKEIAALLNQAGEAHHEYEQNLLQGIYDEEWAMWYAEYAIAHGLERLLDRQLNAAQLSLFLSGINEKYKQEQCDRSWAEYTAEKIVRELPIPNFTEPK